MTAPAPLRFEASDGIGRITLARPDRLNAFDESMAHAWAAATAQAVADEQVQAIVLAAEGPAFCAGGDVQAMATTGSGVDVGSLAEVINRGIRNLVDSSVPVVIAAQGTTAGGGLGILLAGDYAIVTTDARVGSRYANMGLTPDLSVTAQLAAAVGQRRAMQLVLQDRMLSADEAVQWGLVAEAVAPADLAGRAEEIARTWVDSAHAYGQAKRLMRSRESRTFADQLGEEARTIAAAFDTNQAQERIRAFADASAARRRPPRSKEQ